MAEIDDATRNASIHRLPTISASQALKESETSSSKRTSLGLESLDDLLHGGLRRGRVAEVYGPPGVGKTSICLQAAVNAMVDGHVVVWVDACSRLPSLRLKHVISSKMENYEDILPRFHNYATPTLAHLIALLLSSGSTFPPKETALIVIDSVSTLLDNAYPRNAGNRSAFNSRNEHQRWLDGRRQATIGDLASRLAKLAATHDIAVLIANNTVTKIQKETLALLRTGITNQVWENNVVVSICLNRGLYVGLERSGTGKRRHARYASVLKGADAASLSYKNAGCVVPFSINDSGLEELPRAQTGQTLQITERGTAKKRSHDAIADSEDEEGSDNEYGWGEAEVQLAAEGLVDDEYLHGESRTASELNEGNVSVQDHQVPI